MCHFLTSIELVEGRTVFLILLVRFLARLSDELKPKIKFSWSLLSAGRYFSNSSIDRSLITMILSCGVLPGTIIANP